MTSLAALRARLCRVEKRVVELRGDELSRVLYHVPIAVIFELTRDPPSQRVTELLEELKPCCATVAELAVRLVERVASEHASNAG